MALQNVFGALALDATAQQILTELQGTVDVADATTEAKLEAIRVLLAAGLDVTVTGGTLAVTGTVALNNATLTALATVNAAEKINLKSYAKFLTADDTITPAAGKRLQLVWALVVANSDNVAANGVTIRMTIGGVLTDIYAVYALGRSAVFTGDVDTPIVIDLINGNQMSVNMQYREI